MTVGTNQCPFQMVYCNYNYIMNLLGEKNPMDCDMDKNALKENLKSIAMY